MGDQREKNDIYTVYEIISQSLSDICSGRIVQSGFSGTRPWDYGINGCNALAIKAKDISNFEGSECQSKAYDNYKMLLEEYKRIRRVWISDCILVQNSTINTSRGAVLTGKDVMDFLRAKEIKKKEIEEERAQKLEEVKRSEEFLRGSKARHNFLKINRVDRRMRARLQKDTRGKAN